NRVMTHLAARGRLRPYTERIPVDSAEDAAKLAGDDYDADLQKLKNAEVRTKRPNTPIAHGINPQLRRQFEDEYDPEKEAEDPEFEIEKLLIHGFRSEENSSTYKVRYKHYSAQFDDWHLEKDLPKDMDLAKIQ
ncbi:hypothetical protein HK101_000760, partial [Irineochytrium annulatum]